MKFLSYILLFLAGSILFESCKKDDPQPLAYQTQAQLLAGDKGQSKTWRLVSAIQSLNGGTANTAQYKPCFLDNIYMFTNNDKQDYSSNEGPTKCTTTDPDVSESGTWSFTADGKMVIILANKYTTTSPSFYTGFAFPAEVITLTATSLATKMTITQDNDVYVLNFTFAKV